MSEPEAELRVPRIRGARFMPKRYGLYDVVTRLSALAPSSCTRDVDADLYEACGFEVRRFVRNGQSWRYRDDETGRWLSMKRLSTSLDAKLPGEDITGTSRNKDDGSWTAYHGNGPGIGVATAQSEALARRLAYLDFLGRCA